MSSLVEAPARRHPGPAPGPAPVRHGTCRMCVCINHHVYNCKRKPGPARAWELKKLSGERSGAVYLVARVRPPGAPARYFCSCPDTRHNGAVCKHVQALVRLRLLAGPGRGKPVLPCPSSVPGVAAVAAEEGASHE